MSAVIEKRVDNLEELMAELIKAGKEAEERSKQADERLALHIADSQYRMNEFSQKIDYYVQRMEQRTEQFSQRIDYYVQRMEERTEKFSQDMRESRREHRQEMGEIANRLGRLVEDAVYPGISKIFKDITGLEKSAIKESSIRVKKNDPTQREFDAVIIGGGYVLINETKSTLKPEIVKKFHSIMQDEIRAYFPEHIDKKFIGVVSSLYVDDSIIQQGSKLGLYVLGFRDDLMDVLNSTDFKPNYF